jgi:hypothetical protein
VAVVAVLGTMVLGAVVFDEDASAPEAIASWDFRNCMQVSLDFYRVRSGGSLSPLTAARRCGWIA